MKITLNKTQVKTQILDNLLIVCGVVTITYLLYYHKTLITFPWPIQYREGAILLSTELLLKGGNPYGFQYQPYYCNAYGLFYNILVLPFAYIFGSTLILHKIVAGIFTLLTIGLTYLLIKRQSIPLKYSLPMIAITYSSLLYSKTSLAEPDSTGTFLLLAAIAIPILNKFSTSSLFFSIILSCLGYFTKPYFVFGIVAVGLCLLISQQWKKFIAYTICSSLFIFLELFILISIFDSYSINVLFSNYNYGKTLSDWKWIFPQLQFIFTNDKFFYVPAILSTILFWLSNKKNTINEELKHYTVAFFAMTAIFFIFLGKNTGAFATYFFQLSLPLLSIMIGYYLLNLENSKVIDLMKVSLILSMVSICLHYPSIAHSFNNKESEWEKAKALVKSHKNILNSPAIAALLIESGKTVYDSGQTGMFFYGIQDAQKIKPPVYNKAKLLQKEFGDTIYNGIAQKKFDLIMLDREFSNWITPPISIMDNYNYKDAITLYMPHNNFTWHIDVWEPKP